MNTALLDEVRSERDRQDQLWGLPKKIADIDDNSVGILRAAQNLEELARRGGVQDLVTRVPKSGWGYCHVGRPAIYIADGLGGIEILTSGRDWQAVRRKHRVGHLASIRVISRLRRSIKSHLNTSLLQTLRDARQVGLSRGADLVGRAAA